ncbi:hypothetical protein KUCAC02_006495, partial [Chaenocephalus aceratus]
LVYSLPPQGSKSFEDYAVRDFLPTIEAYSTKYKRTDIVFDVYLPMSLKVETRSSVAEGVNDARFDMCARKQRAYKTIPPTQAALLQHLKRAAYQAALCSCRCQE